MISPDLRTLEIELRQQQHQQDLHQLQLLAQVPLAPRRHRLARTLRVLADLLDGQARIALVYRDPVQTP